MATNIPGGTSRPAIFNVKPRRTAEVIAKVFRRDAPAGAKDYLAKYEIRRSIEAAASKGQR